MAFLLSALNGSVPRLKLLCDFFVIWPIDDFLGKLGREILFVMSGIF